MIIDAKQKPDTTKNTPRGNVIDGDLNHAVNGSGGYVAPRERDVCRVCVVHQIDVHDGSVKKGGLLENVIVVIGHVSEEARQRRPAFI